VYSVDKEAFAIATLRRYHLIGQQENRGATANQQLSRSSNVLGMKGNPHQTPCNFQRASTSVRMNIILDDNNTDSDCSVIHVN
jgi:hypothetical protein